MGQTKLKYNRQNNFNRWIWISIGGIIAIFIIFSLMILLFGIAFGTLLTVINKSNKVSIITSIMSSALLIVLLFNAKGYISYMYIPVLLYMIQGKINEYIKYSELKNE